MPTELQVLLLGSISIIATSWLSRYLLLWQRKIVSAVQLLGIALIVSIATSGLLLLVGGSIGMTLFFSAANVAIIVAYFLLQQKTSSEKLVKSETRRSIIYVMVGFFAFWILYWAEGFIAAVIAICLYVVLVGLYFLLRKRSTPAH